MSCIFPSVLRTECAASRRGFGGWGHIDFETGAVQIRANLGKDNGQRYMKNAKTRSSEDVVYVVPEFLEDLKMLRERRLQERTYRLGTGPVTGVTPWNDLDPAEFVCLDRNGRLFHQNGMVGRLNVFQKANGFPVSTIHDLRHTYGTIMAEAGVDILTISKAMRQSSVKITSDQYVAGTDKIRKKASNEMAALITFPNG